MFLGKLHVNILMSCLDDIRLYSNTRVPIFNNHHNLHTRLEVFNFINKSMTGRFNVTDPNLLPKFIN